MENNEYKELQELFAAKRTTEANRRRQEELLRMLQTELKPAPKSRRLWPVWASAAAAAILLLLFVTPMMRTAGTGHTVSAIAQAETIPQIPFETADTARRVPTEGAAGPAVATELSTSETYADIEPVRLGSNGISAYISIMRGCQNYCAYCVVPYTRGRERSRDPQTIVDEARSLFDRGYREVTLLGQNVNSYGLTPNPSPDRRGEQTTFPELMARVAEIDPRLRVRFATSHPKDLSDELLQVMAAHENICRCIHLPVQSGSNRMLKLMNRKYTVEWYLDRVAAIRRYLPDCSITTDVIAGFSTETLEDHQATLDLFRRVRYDYAYMFKYSLREGTYAWKHLADDIPEEEKTRRLNEIIALQGQIALENNRQEVGREYEVLVEGESHRSKEQLFGRNSQNKVIVFDRREAVPGTYRRVRVTDCTAATLLGKLV